MNNLGFIVAAFCGLVLSVSVNGQMNPCEGKDDNEVIEIGCWGFDQCINGTVERTECPEGQVFDKDSATCVEEGQGGTACGKDALCSGKADGSYADIAENCKSFYTCGGEKLMGRQYCFGNLRFDMVLGICNWAHNLEPPCGTKV